jgi:alpha/beta superfamily hydrolase
VELTVFAFDFTGSGLSDGEYVSLGYFEKEDLHAVVK